MLSKRLGAHKELVRGQTLSGFREHSVTKGFKAAWSALNHFKDWDWQNIVSEFIHQLYYIGGNGSRQLK
jgi:hypothetical protein